MGWTTKRWTTEISDISYSSEFLNATVTIVDPDLVTFSGAWDIETNTPPTVVNNGIIAAAIAARINWPLRSVRDPGTQNGDPSEVRAGRMSIRWSDYSGPLRTGLQVFASQGGDNPDLPRFILRIEEALNSSNSASRVMKVAVDGEANYTHTIPELLTSGYGDPGGVEGYGA